MESFDGEDRRVDTTPQLVPARMLNEFAYCPRLCYLEWVQSEFRDSVDTVDGRYRHRRVDRVRGSLSDGGDEDLKIHVTSVNLSGPRIGVATRIDLLEGEGGKVTPVDYKRGTVPSIPEGAYEPERVQLCAQGLVLRENGFDCDEGVIYYVLSKSKVIVPFDEALVRRTVELLARLRLMVAKGDVPPPLRIAKNVPGVLLSASACPTRLTCYVEEAGGSGVSIQAEMTPFPSMWLDMVTPSTRTVKGWRSPRRERWSRACLSVTYLSSPCTGLRTSPCRFSER